MKNTADNSVDGASSDEPAGMTAFASSALSVRSQQQPDDSNDNNDTPNSPRVHSSNQQHQLQQLVSGSSSRSHPTAAAAMKAKKTVNNFAMEHRIFLKAALALLTERDRQAPELGMLDPIVLRAGPLKKAAHLMNGIWKVKYVEIRRGMFSYYENQTSSNSGHHNSSKGMGSMTSSAENSNNNMDGELLRKNIPLQAGACTCRPVKLHQKALAFTPLGAIFELSVHHPEGGGGSNTNNSSSSNTTSMQQQQSSSKRLWMAASRQERASWIAAIHRAMVGGSVTRGNTHHDPHHPIHHPHIHHDPPNESTFRLSYRGVGIPRPEPGPDLALFCKAQSVLRAAKTMMEYVAGLRDICQQPLLVPVKWIAAKGILDQNNSNNLHNNNNNNLNNINNNNSNNNTDASMERAFQEETIDMSVDQLWRDLQRDTVQIDGELLRGDTGHGPERIVGALMRRVLLRSRNTHQQQRSLSESQALVYARDALLAGNRTRTGGDSYFCINRLCSNRDLVVIVPSAREVEPVTFEVSKDEAGDAFHTRFDSKTGWIKTRSRLNRKWQRSFFVLSEGTLSCYEGALPRPHGLKGQLLLKDAVLTLARRKENANQFVVSITVSEGTTKRERLLLFESVERLIDWVYVLEYTVRSSKHNSETMKSKSSRKKFSQEEEDLNCSYADIQTNVQFSTLEHAANLGLNDDVVHSRLERICRRAGSAVRISLRASTEYKICTTDPQGDEELDNWATVRADFLQTLRLTGGPHGRITRCEEVVCVTVVDCIPVLPPITTTTESNPAVEAGHSPYRRSRTRRLFRNTSTDDAGDNEVLLGCLDE
jgi:hypothetical protein